MALTRGTQGPLEWAVAERPYSGGPFSGDDFLVIDRREGPLAAVLDGLGHGAGAARAVRAGVDALRCHRDDPLATMLGRCATAVQGTRGLVATVCSFDHASFRLTWTGIGNVTGLIIDTNGHGRTRRREVVSVGGVVGPAMPNPYIATIDVRPGALLILATDGIDSRFPEAIDERSEPADLARRILSDFGRDEDDALVLVGRYAAGSTQGRPPP